MAAGIENSPLPCYLDNRDLMLNLVHKALAKNMGRDVGFVGEVTNCHHNYARIEEHFGERIWVTRKGAVSARAGELGIIPGSMGAKSFIVRGLRRIFAYRSLPALPVSGDANLNLLD